MCAGLLRPTCAMPDQQKRQSAVRYQASPVQQALQQALGDSIDAALAGVGVVLGRRALVVKDLDDGRLVTPVPIALDTGVRFLYIPNLDSMTDLDEYRLFTTEVYVGLTLEI